MSEQEPKISERGATPTAVGGTKMTTGHIPTNTSGDMLTTPALYVTTQTTIPVLTQVMVAFSLAAVAIAAVATWADPLLPGITTKAVSLWLIALSVLLFVFATESCIKSHAWDYFALSDERRKFRNLRDTQEYINKCLKLSETWHSVAVWSYRFGLIAIILGAAFLFWPISRVTSIILGIYVPTSLVLGFLSGRRENNTFELP